MVFKKNKDFFGIALPGNYRDPLLKSSAKLFWKHFFTSPTENIIILSLSEFFDPGFSDKLFIVLLLKLNGKVKKCLLRV